MLEARDLYCERDERTLFRGLSFTVDAGEWVQVTGGNGAGKTTLLRLLTGLARPDGGEVYWQGEPRMTSLCCLCAESITTSCMRIPWHLKKSMALSWS